MLRLTLGELGKPLAHSMPGRALRRHRDWMRRNDPAIVAEDPEREIYWHVFSSNPVRKREAMKGARLFLERAKSKKVAVRSYRDSFFPTLHPRIKMEFEKLKKEFVPDVVLTHYRHDLHQDHRVICELTWNTFRNHLILEYEIPKYDGDLGHPKLFRAAGAGNLPEKSPLHLDAFETQQAKRWFEKETFLALMRLRGMECVAPSGYAEAFYCRKLVL